MSRRLAELLVERDEVTSKDLEEAIHRQVVYGGSLGTNLLEAAALDEEHLINALAEASGIQAAFKDQVLGIRTEIANVFPRNMAESHRVVPFQYDDKNVWVLVDRAPGEDMLQAIQSKFQRAVHPCITSEVRLHHGMNLLYGTILLPRYQALISQLDGTPVVTEPGLGGDSGRVLSWGMATQKAKAQPSSFKTLLDLRGTLAAIGEAEERDTVIAELMGALSVLFDTAALFVVHGAELQGWLCRPNEGVAMPFATLRLPLTQPSIFHTVHSTQGHYLGPMAAQDIHNNFLGTIQRSYPRAAVVAPMMIGNRMGMMLYADRGERGISSQRVAAALMLVQKAGAALQRIVIRLKREANLTPQVSPMPNQPPEWEGDEVDHDAALGMAPMSTPQMVVRPDGEEDFVGAVQEVEEGLGEAAAGAKIEATVEAAAQIEEEQDRPGTPWQGHEGVPENETNSVGVEKVSTDASSSPEDSFADLDLGDDEGDVGDFTSRPVNVEAFGVTGSVNNAVDALTAMPSAEAVPPPKSMVVAPGEAMAEHAELLEGLESMDAKTRASSIEAAAKLGAVLDDALRERFPGDIELDPLKPSVPIPPLAQCSGLMALLARRGEDAAPVVLPFLESDDPKQRFFALYYFMHVKHPPALDGVARRLYDAEGQNRYLAAETLRFYKDQAGYDTILSAIRAQLRIPVLESQLSAMQLLGLLRDPSCVPQLIGLLESPRDEIVATALASLRTICVQDFQRDVQQWSDWWLKHYNQPRIAWLIAALQSDDSDLRFDANRELEALTGLTAGFDPNGDDESREAGIGVWTRWYESYQAQRSGDQPAA